MKESVFCDGSRPLCRRTPHLPPVTHVLTSFLQVEGTQFQLSDCKPRIIVLHVDQILHGQVLRKFDLFDLGSLLEEPK